MNWSERPIDVNSWTREKVGIGWPRRRPELGDGELIEKKRSSIDREVVNAGEMNSGW